MSLTLLLDRTTSLTNFEFISGLRTVQAATGSHYKIRALFSQFHVHYTDFLSGGDGSGGIKALLLRWNLNAGGIFNSLLSYEGEDLRGAKPTPPQLRCHAED